MSHYKRNQVEESIAATLQKAGAEPAADLRTRMKRLLETDRALATDDAAGLLRPGYAFYTGAAPGRGVEVWFSPYEAFALFLGVLLQQHRWPQGTAVRILRQARPKLEPEHARILALAPDRLFDEVRVRRRMTRGRPAFETNNPSFLAIATAWGSRADADAAPHALAVCAGEEELMKFRRRNAPAGSSMTVLELTAPAHRLAACLDQTKPKTRGRAAR